jgi:hypothetical protein
MFLFTSVPASSLILPSCRFLGPFCSGVGDYSASTSSELVGGQSVAGLFYPLSYCPLSLPYGYGQLAEDLPCRPSLNIQND